MILLRARKNTTWLCVSPEEEKSAVDEETLTSSYQQTKQRGFDPSPEPLLDRLAELPDDAEWDAVVGRQTAGLRLFPCHFLCTVWPDTLTLVSPVCSNVWLTTARYLMWNYVVPSATTWGFVGPNQVLMVLKKSSVKVSLCSHNGYFWGARFLVTLVFTGVLKDIY